MAPRERAQVADIYSQKVSSGVASGRIRVMP